MGKDNFTPPEEARHMADLIKFELRAMANAEKHYEQFADVDDWIKFIWRSAAEIIEATHLSQH